MSKLSFTSQTEVEEAGRKLRQHRIPCDVLHVDAGWFAKGFACDFRFGASFPDPRAMIGKLRESGFRVSLWQLPYFTAKNPLYEEILRENLYIQDGKGEVPTDDAILDLTNPRALTWYAAKIKSLLDLGVSAIKADFGEAAPPEGIYHNGRTTTCHARTHH